MFNKTELGLMSLSLGLILTIFGAMKGLTASADILSDTTVHSLSIALYVGLGLIVLSVVLFVWAGTTAGKE